MEALMLVVERGGPTMLARIGMTRALNRLPQFTEIEVSRNFASKDVTPIGRNGRWDQFNDVLGRNKAVTVATARVPWGHGGSGSGGTG